MLQWQRPVAAEDLSQRTSGVFAHHVIQVLTLRKRMNLGEEPPGDPAQKPLFEQQPLPGAGFVMSTGRQGFQ
ncbi:hypothetical protein A249_30744, partial [Pseudomonas syringae pv. actinidiae ICMP 18804]